MNLPKIAVGDVQDAGREGLPRLAGIRHAFQPIVDIHTGVVHAYEALIRGTAEAGFRSVFAYFDAAFESGEIVELELELARRAFEALHRLPFGASRRLFLNIDGRALEQPSFRVERILRLAEEAGVNPAAICIELSEQHKTAQSTSATMMVAALRAGQVKIALDDFGQGFSELTLLYAVQPEYVKIDRFFITDIASSARKKLFVSTVVNLAHVLGAKVIAEGIETAEEYLACREIGCDFAQGYFIARPSVDAEQLPTVYRHVMATSKRDRRNRNADEAIVRNEVNPIHPVIANASMNEVFERFRGAPDQAFFPVVDPNGEPLGLLHERNLRSFVFNPIGRDILANSFFNHRLMKFVMRCPIADVSLSVERILEIYANNGDTEGVIITEKGMYLGVLSSASLLKLINEKRLTMAQDQNPLTRLPGNLSINNHLADAAEPNGANRVFCYFDFNHFKPFNDHYGFRQGDRAIMLFADILRRHLGDAFLGHIGGDDFFAGLRDVDIERAAVLARAVIEDYRIEITSFYSQADRDKGYLLATSREGSEQIYPLMTCSAAVIEIGAGEVIDDFVALSRRIADAKRAAKLAPDAMHVRRAPSYLTVA